MSKMTFGVFGLKKMLKKVSSLHNALIFIISSNKKRD